MRGVVTEKFADEIYFGEDALLVTRERAFGHFCNGYGGHDCGFFLQGALESTATTVVREQHRVFHRTRIPVLNLLLLSGVWDASLLDL